MGLPKKIAFTGVGIIVSLVLVAILAKKTNLLEGVKSGLSNIGTSLGSGLGSGLQNLGTGFIGSLTGIGQSTAASNLLSNQAGLQDILKGVNPFADPRVTQAYGQVPLGGTTGTTVDNTVVTQANREMIDKANIVLNKAATVQAANIGVPLVSISPTTTSQIKVLGGTTTKPVVQIVSPQGTTAVNYKSDGSYAGTTVTGGKAVDFAVSTAKGAVYSKIAGKTYKITTTGTKRV